MSVVQIHDKSLGNLDWELPEQLSIALRTIPEAEQKIILKEITSRLEGFLHMLKGALFMGPLAAQAMDLINTNQLVLSMRLLAMCEEAQKKT